MIIDGKIDSPYSLALCLEDAISDSSLAVAEQQIVHTFDTIHDALKKKGDFYLPKIFIRVRTPEQITDLCARLEENVKLLCGFIIPKFTLSCSEEYLKNLLAVNQNPDKPIYMMPILESSDLINLSTRHYLLYQLKQQLDEISDYILNIRVGGNDFCKEFGIRRHFDETIYEMHAVSQILADIITVFSQDYVVSGPVWEYFSGEDDAWKKGLIRELKYDRLNGFLGKTVIHPNQIPVVCRSLKVRKTDYEDALSILSWSEKEPLLVGKSSGGERMNEVKTHEKWAKKTVILASVYGVI